MGPRIYVGSLPSPSTETRSCLLCVPHGKVKSACVIRSTISDWPFGYDFAQMGSEKRTERVTFALYGTDWNGRNSTCSPCEASLCSEAGSPISGARPSEAQAGLSTVNRSAVRSLTPSTLISQYKAMTDPMLGLRIWSPECDLEELMRRRQECTRHETVLELVRVDRMGRWRPRRMSEESINPGYAHRVCAIRSKPRADFLLLRKRRKEEIYASHSCQHRSSGGACVVWERNVCS